MVQRNKNAKSSIKLNNKQLNKSKRKNSKTSKIRKDLKSSQKANNRTLTQQREAENLDSEGSNEFENSNSLRNQEKKSLKRKHEDQNDSIESNYKVKSYVKIDPNEKKVRNFALPIKTTTGLLVKNARLMDSDNEDDKKGAKVEKIYAAKRVEQPKSFIEQLQEKKINLEKNKEKIATYSREVLQNPQEEMKKLKEIRQMLNYPEVKCSFILRKLIVVSLCEIYKDILPSYKIRAWTDKEKEQNVGKEVQQQKEFEETLVKQYKLYIDYLNDSIKTTNKALYNSDVMSKSDVETLKSFVIICVKCLGSLLEKLFYFNHANDLIELIVHQLTNKQNEISRLALESVMKIYRDDKTLQLSLEITQKVTKMMKQKSYGIRPEVLDVFLSLKLKEIHIVEDEKNKQLTHKEKMKLSRNDRKKLKEKISLEHDLEEKKASEKLKSKARLQARILEQIFVVYFNILKKAPNFKLIPCVLEGLARYAHLINLDFFDDLIKIMHQMIESDRLTFKSKLHCIKTVFVVLSGQGSALTIDPLRFYNSLYSIILKLDNAGCIENTVLLSECIEMMFFRRRKQIPTNRLMAFVKRLSIIQLQSDPTSALIVLHILRKLININKSSDLLFDNEYQDSGIYNPELPEPDYANAQNSSVWELHLLRNHYSNIVGAEANNLLKDQTITFQDSKRTSEDIINFMNIEENKIFQE